MIQEKSKFLTFVVYENQKPTKCFEFKKSYLQFLFFATPSLLIVGLTLFFFILVYLKNVDLIREQVPPIVIQLKKEKEDLLVKLSEIQLSNQNLLSQLNKPPAGVASSLKKEIKTPFHYPLIEARIDAKDLSQTQLVTISGETLKRLPTQVILSFNIANLNKETSEKISGHIFVILKTGAMSSIYPAMPTLPPYPFQKGESFSVGRFRPVESTFDVPSQVSKSALSFDVIIFAKNGDILFKKSLGPFT